VVEALVTVLCADDDVLDPRAVRPRVDARLHRERHARLERIAVSGHDVRVLVRLEPDAVAGPVEEGRAEAGPGDRLARGRVDRLGGHAGPHRGAGRLLGVVQDLVVRGELGRRLAESVGPGAVRAVPGGHRAADVDHHDIARGQHPVRHLVVRAGRVRPGPDDHEVHGGVSRGQDRLGDHRAHGPLGQPGPQPAGDLGVHPVDGGTRLAQGRHLGRGLPDP
jgi:hypothetical protein